MATKCTMIFHGGPSYHTKIYFFKNYYYYCCCWKGRRKESEKMSQQHSSFIANRILKGFAKRATRERNEMKSILYHNCEGATWRPVKPWEWHSQQWGYSHPPSTWRPRHFTVPLGSWPVEWRVQGGRARNRKWWVGTCKVRMWRKKSQLSQSPSPPSMPYSQPPLRTGRIYTPRNNYPAQLLFWLQKERLQHNSAHTRLEEQEE